MQILKDKYNLLFIILYLLLILSFYFIKLSPANEVILYIISFVLGFGLYSALYFRNRNREGFPLKEILVISILLRVALIFVNPITTDDPYRYLWDGKMQSEGINPYKYAPDSSALSQYHSDELYSTVPHTWSFTIYPPLAQILFYVNDATFGESTTGLKFYYLLLDIVIIIFLFNILKLLGRNTNHVFLYCFAPLILYEFFINAHIDILLLFFMSISIYYAIKGNVGLSFLFFGLAGMSKIYSLIFIPLYVIYFYRKGYDLKEIYKGFLFLLLSFIPIVIYRESIPNIFLAISNYQQNWYYNNMLFKYTAELFASLGYPDHLIVRIIFVGFLITAHIFIIFSKLSFVQKVSLGALMYFIFSPTVHPWYLTFLVLLIPIYFNYASFFWTGFVVLTNITVYYYLKDNVWNDITVILILEYIILILLLFIDIKKLKFSIKNLDEGQGVNSLHQKPS